MEFCEKCGRLLVVKDGKAACIGCGFKPKKKVKLETSEKTEIKERIPVIKETDDNVYPIVKIDCPGCKNKQAYFWTSQTRASDEPETKFYKCTKCNHTWGMYR